jgi:hypothetical protein
VNLDLNKRVAELLGWTGIFVSDEEHTIFGRPPGEEKYKKHVPNYSGDLNAITEEARNIPYELQPFYMGHLRSLLMCEEGVSDFDKCTARPDQICEAFIRTMEGKV